MNQDIVNKRIQISTYFPDYTFLYLINDYNAIVIAKYGYRISGVITITVFYSTQTKIIIIVL